MTKLFHPELSYQVRGVLFEVYNALGPMLQEVYYRDAIGIGLQKRGIPCELEKGFEVFYQGGRVGLYYVDVWIDGGKLLLELKVAPAIAPIHKAQAISYLKVTDADLAILVNYGGKSLEDERLPNFLREKAVNFVWQQPSVDPEWLYPQLVNAIQCACHRVHFTLGPGFLHQVYRRAMLIELRHSSVGYEYIKQLPVEYEGHLLGYQDTRLIVVERKVAVDAFALRKPDEARIAQFKAHLRRLKLTFGMLINFYGVKPEITMVRI